MSYGQEFRSKMRFRDSWNSWIRVQVLPVCPFWIWPRIRAVNNSCSEHISDPRGTNGKFMNSTPPFWDLSRESWDARSEPLPDLFRGCGPDQAWPALRLNSQKGGVEVRPLPYWAFWIWKVFLAALNQDCSNPGSKPKGPSSITSKLENSSFFLVSLWEPKRGLLYGHNIYFLWKIILA